MILSLKTILQDFLYEEPDEEMDDLLKLVVQQKINNETLTAALQEAGGEAAVQQALATAEARAETQYGESIHVEE